MFERLRNVFGGGHDADFSKLIAPYETEEEFFASGERDVEMMLERAQARTRGEKNILLLGVGIGRLIPALSERYGAVVALDRDRKNIAREKHGELENVTFDTFNGSSLSTFRDATFDHVCSYKLLDDYRGARKACNLFGEAIRVTKPGGTTLFAVTDRSSDAGGAVGYGVTFDAGDLRTEVRRKQRRLESIRGDGGRVLLLRVT